MKKHTIVNLILAFIFLVSTAIVPVQRVTSSPDSPTATMPPPLLQFPGINRAGAASPDAFPDTTGAVGHTHYMQAVNRSIAIYRKDGVLFEQVTFDQFWTGAGTGTACDGANHQGQPNLLYDHIQRRWVVVDVAFQAGLINDGPYYLCLAVSRNVPFPAAPPYFAPAFWYYYAIDVRQNFSNIRFYPDSPKLGLWTDGYYLSIDLVDIYNNGLNRTPRGAKVYAFNKDDLQNGRLVDYRMVSFDLPEQMGYEHLVPTNLIGTPPSLGTPNLFASIQPGKMHFWEFSVNWLSLNLSTFGNALEPNYTMNTDTVSKWATGYIIEEPSATEKLEALGERLMTPMQFRIVDGIYTYWVNHTILSNGVTGLRWYEFHKDISGAPFVYQQGTYQPDSRYRWLGSLAVDLAGNMAIGYSVSRSNMNPSIYYTGRLKTEPLGTITGNETAMVNASGFHDNGNGLPDGRWGRQSQMSVDPADECLFWYTNMYYLAGNTVDWQTQIGVFSFANCRQGGLVRVSLHTNGTQGNLSSGMDFEMYSVGISANGRYVAFSSEATNLVNGDVNNLRDVFLRDRDVDQDGIYDEAGQVSTILISRGLGGLPARGNSWEVSVSGNGRYIAFASEADNLILGDTNTTSDVFVYDQEVGNITCVSLTPSGLVGAGRSDQPSISANGRFVVFRSFARDLVTSVLQNFGSNIYLRDRDTDEDGIFDEPGQMSTQLVSVLRAGATPVNADSYTPTISDADFERISPVKTIVIAFASRAPNLDPAFIDNDTTSDVYIREIDLVNPALTQTVLGGVTQAGGLPNFETNMPYISGDGNYLVFTSLATNIDTVVDTLGFADIFWREWRVTTLPLPVIRISTGYFGGVANGNSYSPSVSRNGRFVAFASDANNIDLAPQDLNNKRDIFLYDRDTGFSQRITLDYLGGEPNEWSFAPVIAADGGYVAFVSEATDLVNNDTNSKWDVFVYNGLQDVPIFLSIPGNVPARPGQLVTMPVIFNNQGQSIDTTTFSVDFDQNCLAFNPADGNLDGIPDAITFSVSSDFITTVRYNAGDLDGELDFSIYDWIPPRAPLASGTLATIQFTVKATCQAAPGYSNHARVGFSDDPKASFGYFGQSIPGGTADGYVRILQGELGDCNGDGRVDAGDLSALVLEIFDGDSSDPDRTPGGTFPGNPVGCNPNQDFVVDAGDLSCTILIIHGSGAACTGTMTMLSAQTQIFGNNVAFGTIKLVIPDRIPAKPDTEIAIPVMLDTGGQAINSAIFSIDYDGQWLALNPADSDVDGIPDSITLDLPKGFVASVAFDPQDADGELDVVVYSLNPSLKLADGTILQVYLKTGTPSEPTLAKVDFGLNPWASFGSANGQSLFSELDAGSAFIAETPYRMLLPLLVR